MFFFLSLDVVMFDVMVGTTAAILPLAWFGHLYTWNRANLRVLQRRGTGTLCNAHGTALLLDYLIFETINAFVVQATLSYGFLFCFVLVFFVAFFCHL